MRRLTTEGRCGATASTSTRDLGAQEPGASKVMLAAASVRPDVTLLRVRDEGAPARAVYAATVRGRSLPPAASAFPGAVREATAKIPA
ncbi:hypothetical protein ACFWMJ_11645 [Streptomyces hawaiiensis]|uniref:hypothetical protein n=1 Tax=Streptomyces hawaiiensis TaxID=67305 RepID=UPI0036520FD8